MFRSFIAFLLILCHSSVFAQASEPNKKIRALFFYGGHDFDKKSMDEMLGSFTDVQFDKAEMPKSMDLLKPELSNKYDCIVLYDMYTFPFTDEQTNNYIDLLKKGIGVVVLHHSVCGYDNDTKFWDEYTNIIGARYVLNKKGLKYSGQYLETQSYPPSTYKHDETLNVSVVDTKHPIVAGISDFTILDEAYGGVLVLPNVHVMLTTDNPKSTKQIAWTWKYENSPVFTTLLGHDANAYKNENFRKLIHQAIHWVCQQNK